MNDFIHILLVRHGESMADILKVHEGRADFLLTEKGKSQALKLAHYLKENYQIKTIYTSTLKRAQETASIVNKVFDIPFILSDDLREWDNGLIAGLKKEEAEKKYPRVVDLPINESVYEQESMLDFRNRAKKAINKIIDDSNTNDTILIVSHGGMIDQIFKYLFNMEIKSNIFFVSNDTAIHSLYIKKTTINDIRIEYLNRTIHLN